MKINFCKYNGNGNDFIVIDNRNNNFPSDDIALINRMCNRNFGIGGDGLMLLELKPGYDFHMRYFNSDGREGTMCGNGGRCMVHYANRLGLAGQTAVFSGIDGRHEAVIYENRIIRLRMKDVLSVEKDGEAFLLDTGSPHYVLFTDNVEGTDVVGRGKDIRYSGKYGTEGINVNFAGHDDKGIYVRTYERGVENETLACGTGSVAAAICSRLDSALTAHTVKVRTPGGLLEVSFKKDNNSRFTEVWLSGPAQFVFEGTVDTNNLLD